MDKVSLGWRLRIQHVLRDTGASYRDLARLSGLNYTTIQAHLSGAAQSESLTFIRQVCEALNLSLQQALFGLQGKNSDIMQVPLLRDDQVSDWVNGKDTMIMIEQWLPHPSMLSDGLRVFAWKLPSSDLEPEWSPGCWLYIDPDDIPKKSDRRMVVARLETGSLLARWREVIADDIWLVPEKTVHQSVRLGNADIIGSVIGGIKASGRH